MESKQLYLFIVSISIALIEENSLIGTCIKRDECLSPFSMEIEGREEGDGVVDIQQADLMTKEQELDVLKRVLCQTHFEMTTMKLRAEAIQQELLSQDNPNLTNVLDFINDFLSLPSHIPSIVLSNSMTPSTAESQPKSAPVEDLPYQTDDLEQSVDTLRSVVDENGSVIDDLQKLHLDSVSDLRQRLQILYSNNKLLTSIIEDNNQHTHELMVIINEKNAEILRLRDSYEDTISSLNSQLFSTQTELQCVRMEHEKILAEEDTIQNVGEKQEENVEEEKLSESYLENEILQERIDEMKTKILEMESSKVRIEEVEKEAEMRIANMQRETEAEIRSLEAKIRQKDVELGQLQTCNQELEKVNESQKMDCSLHQTQLQCMKTVQTAILHVMDRLERNRMYPASGIISAYKDQIQNSPASLVVPQTFVTIETPMGSVSTSDPEAISRLIKSLSIRLKMAEAKVASLERTTSREDLLRDELQRKTEELALVRSEMQKSKGESVDLSRDRMIENLSRNNEILKRNETVYLQVLRELKRSVRRKDKQLQEFQIILDNVRKTQRLYFVSCI